MASGCRGNRSSESRLGFQSRSCKEAALPRAEGQEHRKEVDFGTAGTRCLSTYRVQRGGLEVEGAAMNNPLPDRALPARRAHPHRHHRRRGRSCRSSGDRAGVDSTARAHQTCDVGRHELGCRWLPSDGSHQWGPARSMAPRAPPPRGRTALDLSVQLQHAKAGERGEPAVVRHERGAALGECRRELERVRRAHARDSPELGRRTQERSVDLTDHDASAAGQERFVALSQRLVSGAIRAPPAPPAASPRT